MTDIVTPTPIDALPPAPSPGDSAAEFNAKSFPFVAAEVLMVPQINTAASQTNQNAVAANERAVAAGTSRDQAQTAAGTATTQAGIATGAAGTATTQAGIATDAATTAAAKRDEAVAAAGAASPAATSAVAARDAAIAARDQAQVYATAQLKATSSTSLTPGTGSKSFVIEPSRSFVAGMYLVATSSGTPADKMSGTVVSYNITTGALVLSVDKFAGTTARADWVIGVAAQAADSGQLPYVAVTGTTQAAVTGFLYGLQNAAATTITLPASPANGDMIGIKADNLRIDNVIGRNGNLVMGLSENMVIDNPYYPIRLQYQSPYGWRLV